MLLLLFLKKTLKPAQISITSRIRKKKKKKDAKVAGPRNLSINAEHVPAGSSVTLVIVPCCQGTGFLDKYKILRTDDVDDNMKRKRKGRKRTTAPFRIVLLP